jgi:cytosol aminopeptidase
VPTWVSIDRSLMLVRELMRVAGGAAAVVSAALAIAKLRLPYVLLSIVSLTKVCLTWSCLSVNLVVVTPLCENLPGPSANKPGDM